MSLGPRLLIARLLAVRWLAVRWPVVRWLAVVCCLAGANTAWAQWPEPTDAASPLSVSPLLLRVALPTPLPSLAVVAQAQRLPLMAGDMPRFKARMGLEWTQPGPRFAVDGLSRTLGVQIDTHNRLSFKLRHNGVGVYLRRQF